MARLLGCVAAAVVAAALGGCAENYAGVRPFWKLRDAIMQIRAGMTRDEVVKLAGNPVMVFRFDRLQEERWRYNYLEGQIRMKSWVHFGLPDGVVKMHTQEYDLDYYSVEGN